MDYSQVCTMVHTRVYAVLFEYDWKVGNSNWIQGKEVDHEVHLMPEQVFQHHCGRCSREVVKTQLAVALSNMI